MSIIKLAKIIKTKDKAAKTFQRECWQRGFGCVKCGSIKVWKHQKLKNGLQKYQCQDCWHVFSDQSWTLLRWNKASIEKVAIVNHLSRTQLQIREIANQSELNKNTVYEIKRRLRKIRQVLYRKLRPSQLSGIVEMDETKTAKNWFWGAIQRHDNQAVVEWIPNRSAFIMDKKIWRYVQEHSTIMTDELASYMPHPRYFQHFAVKHSKYFVHPECKVVHTNRIEGLWAQIKRKIHHLCNGVKLEHIQSYIDELLYLKNHDSFSRPTFFPLYCQKT